MPALLLDLMPSAPPPAHAPAGADEHLLASVWPEPETTHFKQRATPRQLLYSLGTHDLQLRVLSPRGGSSGYRLCGTVYGDCAGGVVSWWPLALGPTTAALDIDLAGPGAVADSTASLPLALAPVASASLGEQGVFVLEVPGGCGVLRLWLADQLLELAPLGLSGF
ncbi:hypothetical protein [Rubrivivax rivuli]|uniref:Uncharacterized protein n=1 Tax=Rubrivivax rivuli TaxID=1862385 RepID=A0A437RR65_9BURK|nr:hypothetical protein [Rubrivivax rivuli]RVU49273.1 hypothetical protein EOE66_01480 [Rubrivivax rivuli]